MKNLMLTSLLLLPFVIFSQSSTNSVQPVLLIEDNTYTPTKYKSIKINGINIAYREAGNPKNPTIVLLHGFPSSSHQYRKVLTQLSDEFHLIAPDYPGFGNSDFPSADEYEYTFNNIVSELRPLTRKESGPLSTRMAMLTKKDWAQHGKMYEISGQIETLRQKRHYLAYFHWRGLNGNILMALEIRNW